MKSTTSLRRVGCLHAQLAPYVQLASAEEGLFRNNLAAAADDGGKKVVAKEEDALLFPSPVQAMAREREAVSFNVRRLTHLLEGEEGTKWLDLAAQLIERDPVLYDGHVSSHDLTVPEHREKTMRKIARYMEYVRRGPLSANEPLHLAFNRLMHTYDSSFSMRIGVHFALFHTAIHGGGTPEQIAKYADDIKNMRVIGCFGMTELGNGTSIQSFETTATFRHDTDTFAINSPTLTSTKWWIGMSAQSATHCIVFARLLIDGRDHGVHNFIVPIRNMDTGRLLPGVTIGDIGSKWGRHGLDNGYLRFTEVHIPRENMLMKWSQVSRDGQYTAPPIPQMAYGALVGGRVAIMKYSADIMKKAVTIATRYAAVRRQHTVQGRDEKTGKRKQLHLLDLQSHQLRLFPLIAEAFALHFVTKEVGEHYQVILEQLRNNDLSSLADFHSTTSGLKDGIETCRRCCGGHGFHSYSGLPSTLADWAVFITGEGDNMPMAQQNARFLMSAVRKIATGKGDTLKGTSVQYLHDGFETIALNMDEALRQLRAEISAGGKSALLNPATQEKILATLALVFIFRTANKMQQEMKTQKQQQQQADPAAAWNRCMADLVLCSKFHCLHYMFRSFASTVTATAQGDGELGGVLKSLCDLYALWNLSVEMKHLLQEGVLAAEHAAWVDQLIKDSLLPGLRRDAVGLVDAWHIPDFVLGSVLGVKDGDVYRKYFDAVATSRYQEMTREGQPFYWDSVVRPLLRDQ